MRFGKGIIRKGGAFPYQDPDGYREFLELPEAVTKLGYPGRGYFATPGSPHESYDWHHRPHRDGGSAAQWLLRAVQRTLGQKSRTLFR